MAGAGYRLYNTGDVLTAAQVNTYLQQQTVMVFANSTARSTALSGVVAQGMVTFLTGTNSLEYYDGSAWQTVSNPGDITGITTGATSGLTGGVTSGTADLKLNTTAKGGLLIGTGSGTVSELAVGTNNYVLTADSTQTTGIKWAAASSGGGMTSIASGALASAIEGVSITSISGSYNHLQLIIYNYSMSQDGYLCFRFNNDNLSNYTQALWDFTDANASANKNVSATSAAWGNYDYSNDLGSNYYAIINIFNYASTSMNKLFTIQVSDKNASGTTNINRWITGRWMSDTAINSIQVRTEGSPTTFDAGSYLLYGVK